jgi:hypothetical protein
MPFVLSDFKTPQSRADIEAVNLTAVVLVAFIGICAVAGVAETAGPAWAVATGAVAGAALRWLVFHIEHSEN